MFVCHNLVNLVIGVIPSWGTHLEGHMPITLFLGFASSLLQNGLSPLFRVLVLQVIRGSGLIT